MGKEFTDLDPISVINPERQLRPGADVAAVGADHFDIGAALQRAMEHQDCGRMAEAERIYQQILSRQPDHARALHDSGLMAQRRGDKGAAADLLYRSLLLEPQSAEFRVTFAALLGEVGRDKEALGLLDEAVRLREDYAQAHTLRGNVLRRLDRPAEALTALRKALELKPDSAEAHQGLGDCLRSQGNAGGALPHLNEAVRLAPQRAEAHFSLGRTLQDLGQLAEATAAYRRAAELKPTWGEAYCNLGALLHMRGNLPDAVVCLRRAAELMPDAALPRSNLAMALLASGAFESGWAEYEWRRRGEKEPRPDRTFAQPEWNGCSVKGRTVLVICEQGLGDTIQFIRYVPLLAARGADVVVECQPPLVPLLRQMEGIGRVIAKGEPVRRFDTYVLLMSLPGIFQTRPETIPAPVPYLHPDPDRLTTWKERLGTGFKVGIVWQGNSAFATDKSRSVPLRHFRPLSTVPGVRLFSLQRGPGTEQVQDVTFRVNTLEPLDEGAAFLDTAAIIANLDLVIGSDTSVVHLAGALGVPVWVALCYSPDWRWMMGREDSPWYPAMRLFRQPQPGQWDPVFQQIAEALRQRVEKAAPPAVGPLLAPLTPGQLLDRISILRIKAERCRDGCKASHVRNELDQLLRVRLSAVWPSEELEALEEDLRRVNEALWEVEDRLRLCEATGSFGSDFVQLARSVYQNNDRRHSIKRRIDLVLGSAVLEEKLFRCDGDSPAAEPAHAEAQRRGPGARADLARLTEG